ncbi:vegetative cell wall protein gp1-like [Iris pallida]|uniref:Vegetative cell wall protein gp1-like n=1 Tax=Iris pallida TaxID=29817 RepID=A0AAX6FG64_IRIPA|nr:vegetative cell wall protein gp1-like [Iris pallida]KAJ6815309.1 vegetative cell wall protein gp1-like [Iris pallida]
MRRRVPPERPPARIRPYPSASPLRLAERCAPDPERCAPNPERCASPRLALCRPASATVASADAVPRILSFSDADGIFLSLSFLSQFPVLWWTIPNATGLSVSPAGTPGKLAVDSLSFGRYVCT